MKEHVMFPKDQLIPRLPGPNRPGRYWRVAVALLTICSTVGAVPALAAPGGGEAVPSTTGPFELQNTVTTLCLTDEGDGFVDTEACTAGDRAQQWQRGVSLSTFHGVPNVTYPLINLQSGQCLENDSYGEGYGNLHTAPCINASSSQGWTGYNLGPLPTATDIPVPTTANIPGSQSLLNLQTNLCLESDISVSLDTGPISGNAYAQQCTVWHWQWWATPTS
jgi:hypothetical protein